jgi:hypothetical protein
MNNGARGLVGLCFRIMGYLMTATNLRILKKADRTTIHSCVSCLGPSTPLFFILFTFLIINQLLPETKFNEPFSGMLMFILLFILMCFILYTISLYHMQSPYSCSFGSAIYCLDYAIMMTMIAVMCLFPEMFLIIMARLVSSRSKHEEASVKDSRAVI